MITNVYVCVCDDVWMIRWNRSWHFFFFSMRIHNGAMRWLMGQRIDEWTFKRNRNDECHDCNGWRCDINDNDLWTISWFTTNKQVAVHILTTIVRILAYSDATLFRHVGNSFAENPRTTFRAKSIAYARLRLGLKITTTSSFQQNRSQNDPIIWNLYDRLLMLRKKKNKVGVSLLFEKFHSQIRATNFVNVNDCCDCT